MEKVHDARLARQAAGEGVVCAQRVFGLPLMRLACLFTAALLAAFALAFAALPGKALASPAAPAPGLMSTQATTSSGHAIPTQKLGKCKIEADDLEYTGKAQKPHVTVKSPARSGQMYQVLHEGFHYTVTYQNAKGKKISTVKAPGTYRAIVKGRVGYTGKVVKKFKVVKTNYKYQVKFMNQPYSEMTNCVFVKTKNPDPTSISLAFKKSGRTVDSEVVGGVRYDDVPAMRSLKESELNYFVSAGNGIHVVTDSAVKVKGGLIIPVTIEESGKMKVYVVEHILNNKSKSIKAGKIKVRNYRSEQRKWMNQVIAQTTNDTMTKPEKMKAIADYLGSIGKYPKNYVDSTGDMHTVSLSADAGIPYWKCLRWDSYDSPAMLVKFGNRIGYPLHNKYGDYPLGSMQWLMYHYYAESEDDGTLYECCPLSNTGLLEGVSKVKDIKAMNFLKYKHFVTAK